MLRNIKSVQRGVRLIHCQLNASAGTLVTGGAHVTLTDNGTGDFTFTLNNPSVRPCQAIVVPTEDDTQFYVSDATVSYVRVKTETVAGVAADKNYFLTIVCFDSADE